MKHWISRMNPRRGRSWLLAVGAVFLFLSSLATAQEGTILGTVSDPTGAVVPNASISIVNLETGLSSEFVSDAVGQYVAPGLRIGHYTMKVTAPGFKALEKTGVVVQVATACASTSRWRLEPSLRPSLSRPLPSTCKPTPAK